MTKETLELAKDFKDDIETLKEIQNTMNKNHWVAFTTAEKTVKEQSFYSDFLIDEFKRFVDEKLLEATKKFEEL